MTGRASTPAVLPQPGPEGGLGLFNIRERLADLGGEVEMDSAPGAGARLRLTVPLEPSRP
jgi:two-component system, NarL family, sensor histidine kinase DegS